MRRSIQKLTLFRQFYVLTVIYIYVTRIVIYLLQTGLPYSLQWVSAVAEEGATLAFYALTAWHFQPRSDNPYLQLDELELHEAGMHAANTD